MTSKLVYGWKESRGFKVSAQIVGETLEHIEKKRGEVTPRAVVEEAKPIESPLHTFFEWDDSKAADGFRDEQARRLVACVVVKAYDGDETRNPTRAFVSVNASEGRSYVGIVTAMSDEQMRAQVLAKAQSEIVEWRQRYAALNEFSKIFTVIDKLAAKTPSKRRAVKSVESVAAPV